MIIADSLHFTTTQMIIGRELNQKNHTWLKALSNRVQKQEMRELLEKAHSLTRKADRELADSVLEVSVRANRQIVGELRGDESMCQALLEIMEPEINEIVESKVNKIIESKADEIRKSGVQKGQILGAVSVYRDLGLAEDEILNKLQEKYHLSVKEAESFLLADGV